MNAAGRGPEPLSDAEIFAWQQYQVWLRYGPRDVVVPYAEDIAANVDLRAIRIRRDYPSVLSLIQASALMHRAQRDIDREGRIIAAIGDYALALAALGDGLEEVVRGETVTRFLLAQHKMKLRYLRHPYLDSGPDIQTRRASEPFLSSRGYQIAPITIDMALTRACNYACHYCYAMLQENDRKIINRQVIFDFLEDCAKIGVKGISFVSDGESTISPVFVDAVRRGHELGLSMAVGTNAFVFNCRKLEEILPSLTYLRVNISPGERARYGEIMGVT